MNEACLLFSTVNLKVTSLTTIENNLLPVVTVTWELEQG